MGRTNVPMDSFLLVRPHDQLHVQHDAMVVTNIPRKIN